MDLENKLTAVRGEGCWELGEKHDGIKQRRKIKEKLLGTDTNMVIARGKRVKEG